jgi:hypothetical protein
MFGGKRVNHRFRHFCRGGRIGRIVEIQQKNAHHRIVQAEELAMKPPASS